MAGETQPTNAFTIDLEDWFQGLTSTNPLVERWPRLPSTVVPMTVSLLQLLETHRVQATFFVLGYVADQHPDLIAHIRARGHEIGVHGYFHRFVNRLTSDDFARELDRAIDAIYRITREAPLGHRAPYFSIDVSTPWAFDRLSERGFRYDSSVFPMRNFLYGYAGAPRGPHGVGSDRTLLELPVSTLRLARQNLPFAGGFYLRSLPYPIVRWAIRRLHAEGLPAIFYLHPWELDLMQPRRRVTARERITHFHGRWTLRAKLEHLFADFRFGPLSALLNAGAVSGQRC
jgi:polysaccharide deacetylase family protein (PEP-CTERM system associated)